MHTCQTVHQTATYVVHSTSHALHRGFVRPYVIIMSSFKEMHATYLNRAKPSHDHTSWVYLEGRQLHMQGMKPFFVTAIIAQTFNIVALSAAPTHRNGHRSVTNRYNIVIMLASHQAFHNMFIYAISCLTSKWWVHGDVV